MDITPSTCEDPEIGTYWEETGGGPSPKGSVYILTRANMKYVLVNMGTGGIRGAVSAHPMGAFSGADSLRQVERVEENGAYRFFPCVAPPKVGERFRNRMTGTEVVLTQIAGRYMLIRTDTWIDYASRADTPMGAFHGDYDNFESC